MGTDRRIRFGDVLVPYDDATDTVQIQRTVTDILKATPGDDKNCMNSQCIKAQRNKRVFPHAVYAVSTIKSRVYIIDQLDDAGNFAHAIRYELSAKDSALIQEHDSHAAGEPGELTLKVPRDPKGSANKSSWNKDRYPSGSRTGGKSRPITSGRGATARMKVAVGALEQG